MDEKKFNCLARGRRIIVESYYKAKYGAKPEGLVITLKDGQLEKSQPEDETGT